MTGRAIRSEQLIAEFKIYPAEHVDRDGYPPEWQIIKHIVRDWAGHRCVRCGHPYRTGEHGTGEWTPCDERCTHRDPIRGATVYGGETAGSLVEKARRYQVQTIVEAHWRILTVHHLNGRKCDLRWHNLVALCQRCHLTIQGKVTMEQIYVGEHSEWFKPYAAAYYASVYLDEEITPDDARRRMPELLALERQG